MANAWDVIDVICNFCRIHLNSIAYDDAHLCRYDFSFLQEANFPHEANTVFKSQEKYVISLGAPTSIAQKHGEDTLTYLNKGTLYSVFLLEGKIRTLDNCNFLF